MSPSERPPEKTNYSYQEMMERLKRERRGGGSKGASGGGAASGGRTRSRSSGGARVDGGGGSSGRASGEGAEGGSSQPVRIEVVENPDGTKSEVEVRRRRRRRSHQPKKAKEERRQKLKRKFVLIGVPAVLLLFGLYFFMLSRIKSEAFRAGSSAQLSQLSGTELEFGGFHLNGTVLHSRKAVAKGVPGTLIRGAEVNALKASLGLGSLVSSDWSLGMVQGSSGEWRFGLEGMAGASGFGLGASSERGADERLPVMAAGLGLDRKPGKILAEGLQLGSSNLIWEGKREPIVFLEDSNITTGRPGSNPLSLIFTGGKLAVPSWPEFRVRRLSGEVSSGVYRIQQSLLDHGNDALVKLSGNIGFTGLGDYALEATYTDIEVREIVHPYWTDSFGGEVDGTLTLSGKLADPSSLRADGEFATRKFTIGNNRMLRTFAHQLGEALLQRIEFRTLTGRYRRDAEKTEFYNIVGRQPTLFEVRGRVATYFDGRLDGELELGIPDTILNKLDGGRPPMFGDPLDGVCWTKVRLTGMVDQPREDLTDQLMVHHKRVQEASRSGLPPVRPPAGGTPPTKAGDLFEELIQPQ